MREELDKNGDRGGGTLSGKVLAPQMCRSTNRQVEPEVYFRIVHLARNGPNSAPVAAYREQTVEIPWDPRGRLKTATSAP